jgi:hydroxyacylglutathione hydrolase
MILQRFHTAGLSINTYLIADSITHRALIIDPTNHVEPYLKFAEQENLAITDIAETHVHADFISGSKILKSRLQGKATIHCSALGGDAWIPRYADVQVFQDHRISLGSVVLKALGTPGHTPEHLLWLCFDSSRSSDTPCLAFTGDFLFVGSIGRPDLLGPTEVKNLSYQMYNSLFSVLLGLPDFLEIYPAHGAGSLCGKGLSARPTSTLGYEKRFNSFLQKKEMEEWIQDLQRDISAAPANFTRIKKLNLQGEDSMISSPKKETNHWIVDIRTPPVFATGHIADSINIPLGPSFCNWVGSFLNEECSITLIGENEEQIHEAIKNLSLIGFNTIKEKIIWDNQQMTTKYTIQSLHSINVLRLAEELKTNPYVLDVRTSSEWNAGHIKDAHHIELAKVAHNFHQLPKDSSIFTICGSGMRSSIASSFLKKMGYERITNVEGGMTAWKNQNFQTVMP